jgi:hypothetical protein
MRPDLPLPRFTGVDDPAKPDHYVTKTHLTACGLIPGDPVAVLVRPKQRKPIYLYDRHHAVPRQSSSAIPRRTTTHQPPIACTACGTMGIHDHRIAVDSPIADPLEPPAPVCAACFAACAVEERRIAVQALRAQAQAWLAACVIVALKTTDDDDPDILELGVIDHTGTVFLRQRVTPLWEPERPAVALHGSTLAIDADAPDLTEVVPALAAIVHGKTVLVADQDDIDTLINSLDMRDHDPGLLLDQATWCDLLEPYSDWFGNWDDRRRRYRWEPLVPTHDVIGDCLALRARLQEMAAWSLYGGCGIGAVALPDSLTPLIPR